MKQLLAVLFYCAFLLIVTIEGVILLYTPQQRAMLGESLPALESLVSRVEHRQSPDHIFTESSESIQTLRLYSPYHKLQWNVDEGGIVTIQVRHQNQWVLYTTKPRIGRDRTRDSELSLANQNLLEWTHIVTVTTAYLYREGSVQRYRLEVQYDRIQIWETTLYLDPHHIPAGEDQDFLRSTSNLEWDERHFLTYGCDPDAPEAPILIESYHQWRTIEACLSFSIPEQQVLFFDYQAWYEWEHLYTISTPERTVRELFGLFIHYDGIVVMNLPFWDQDSQRLTSLAGRWSLERPSLRVRTREGDSLVPLYDILLLQSRDLTVETPREKLSVSLYTERDNVLSSVFPGSYYQYFLKSFNTTRNQVNAGPLTSALPQKYSMPLVSGLWSTFGLDLTIQDNELRVFDGYQDTVMDLGSIGKTIKTQPREFVPDQPTLCEDAELDIIIDQPYKQAVQWPGKWWMMLVGKWWHTQDLRIQHNWSTRLFRPHHLEQGHLWHALDQSEFLTKGTNIYIVRVYDERGAEVCRKRVAVKY